MNKEEILQTLKDYNFNKEEILIISGASMVINNIKEKTNDIDIAVSKEYEKILIDKYGAKIKQKFDNYNVYTIDKKIDFSAHYYNNEYDIKYGYKIQKPKEILKIKQQFKREKDIKDIELINNYFILNYINSLALAYLGDAIYEVYIRKHLITKGTVKVNELQKKAIEYVSAKSQSDYLDKLLDNNILNNKEIDIVKRARNHKSHKSKTADIITYKKSTGLEALIGYLYLKGNIKRIEEIIKYIVGDNKCIFMEKM